MSLKPWYKVVTSREDPREGRHLDVSEFAVHLDDVGNNKAPPDYQKPDRFLARTYLTKNLSNLSSQVIRCLSGDPKKPEQLTFTRIAWTGEVPWQKWRQVLHRRPRQVCHHQGLKLKVSVEIAPDGGVSKQKIEETKAALRELGMNDDLTQS